MWFHQNERPKTKWSPKWSLLGFEKTFPFEMIAEMIAHQNDRRAPKAREKKYTQNDRWNDRPLKWSPGSPWLKSVPISAIIDDHFGGEVL